MTRGGGTSSAPSSTGGLTRAGAGEAVAIECDERSSVAYDRPSRRRSVSQGAGRRRRHPVRRGRRPGPARDALCAHAPATGHGGPDLQRGPPNGRFVLAGNGARPLTATDAGELLLVLDQELMIRLQTLRADLYFIHAGVLDCAGKAFMLVAPSGGGKSTTVWGLVHHGFRYLSDELGPIDLRTMTIHPYPRALTLKSRPPGSYPLPRGTLATSRGFHIAPDTMPGGIRADAAPLAAVFFLRHVADAPEPAVTSISPAEAVARLYANVLNALAHPEEGLDGAVRIVRQTACFELITADLAATCALVEATVTGLAWG